MSEGAYFVWSRDRLLAWSDYTADPNPSVYEDASSYIKYNCTWTVSSRDIDDQIKFAIENIKLDTCFYPHLSWVRSHHMTDQLLVHEQGHFDLAEMTRIELVPKILDHFKDRYYVTRGQNQDQQRQFAREDSSKLLFTQIEKIESILTQKRLEYDRDTEYGTNADKQDMYNSMFSHLRT